LNIEIDLDELGLTDKHVFSWCGNVHVNGLRYGNGGLKMWTREFVNNMKTHENADATDHRSVVEFCFSDLYYQFNTNYCTSYTNETPFQAWRAGFREGVKMSLNQGEKTSMLKSVWWQNYDRLLIWCNVGADVKNGIWSMLGAREGVYMTNCTDWDYTQVRDFEYLTEYWYEMYGSFSEDDAKFKIVNTGQALREELDLEVAELDDNASKFFKQVYENTPRIIGRIK
jgi:hypothetical protein